MVVVAEIHPHVPKFQAFTAQCYAGKQSDIGECAVVIVVIEIIRHGVVGDQEVGPAIVIVIAPSCAGTESSTAYPGLLCDVLEPAIAQIVIEHVAAIAGDKKIELAIIIVVSYGDPHTPAAPGQTSFLSNVFESAIWLL